MARSLADIIKKIETIAPPHLTESWDNAGLQLGQLDWPVETIWIALDPLPEVVGAAIDAGADLLITHHPLFFRPLQRLIFDTPVGALVKSATEHQLAVYAAHTNLDSVSGGVNDALASRIGLEGASVLVPAADGNLCKLVVFLPAGGQDEQRVLDALFETPAGRIGAYTCCSFRSEGTGTFRPGTTAEPYVGETGSLSQVAEIRVETVVAKEDLSGVISHIRACHPYETMAYDVYPILSDSGNNGLGRIGSLDQQITLGALATSVKRDLGLNTVRIGGDPKLLVDRVALCTGSGSSFVSNFLASDAQVFISGDLHYHDARTIDAEGRGLIDVGHFASERLVLDILQDRLSDMLDASDEVQIAVCGLEKDPFIVL